jgi:hypothetical protein
MVSLIPKFRIYLGKMNVRNGATPAIHLFTCNPHPGLHISPLTRLHAATGTSPLLSTGPLNLTPSDAWMTGNKKPRRLTPLGLDLLQVVNV